MSELTEKEFRDLKDEVQQARATADRAKGAVETLVKSLKEEFGCESAKEAKALLAKLEKEKEDSNADFQKALKAYRSKWHPDTL